MFSRRDALLQMAGMACAVPGARFAAAAPSGAVTGREIDAALQAHVDAGEVPGIVAMAATAHAVIYQGMFGVRDIAMPAKISADTIFRVASMVKLLTSVAALQLVEQGKLGLDEPVEKIDPTLASPQVLSGFDAHGTPQLRPARRPITLRNLLTHTSGFSYPLWDANAKRYLKMARDNPALPRSVLMFDPNDRWAYGWKSPAARRWIAISAITSCFRSA
jgi:methyl acetate hydrolase